MTAANQPNLDGRPGSDPALDRRRGLTRDTIQFGLGSLAGKVIAFITLPILARLMTPEEFGRLDVLNALISASVLTLLLGTDVAATRLYFEQQLAWARRELLATWYVLGVALIAPLALVLVFASAQVSEFLFSSAELALAVALLGVITLAGMIYTITLGVLRTVGRPRDYALLEGGALILNAVLAVGLLVIWRPDASAVMLALAVSWSGAALIGVAAVWSSISSRPSRAAAGALLRLGLPLAPAVAATWGSDFFNRAFLLGSAGAAQAGLLSVAIRIASVAGLLVAATQLAWQPHAYRLGVSQPALVRLGVEARQILIALSVCVVALGLLTPEVVAIIAAGRYGDARAAVGLCLVGVLGTGIFVVASLPSAMARETREISAAALVGVGVAVTMNVVAAPALGAFGTATAIAGGQLAAAGVAILLGRRHPRMLVAWPRVCLVLAIAAVMVLMATVLPVAPLAARSALGIVFAVAIWIEGTWRLAFREARQLAQRAISPDPDDRQSRD